MQEPPIKETILPILKYKHQILDKIASSQVTIICGETGCGKTTQVPQYILSQNPNSKVIITQPRRIAAVSVAQRVAFQQNSKVGAKVGYHIGMDCKVSRDTRISYVTTGILLEKLTNDPTFLETYTHIIFDQVHQRGIECDFNLIAMKLNLCQQNTHKFKIIVMSATLNSALFREFFATSPDGQFIKATIDMTVKEKRWRKGDRRRSSSSEDEVEYSCNLSIQPTDNLAVCITLPTLRKFNIDVKYLEDLASEKNYSYMGQVPVFNDSLVNLAVKVCEDNLWKGDILIFVPGMREIKMVTHAITAKSLKCRLFELHSQFNTGVSELFAASQIPKIIVSTNIAQSSITLPDCKVVIDFCMTKQHQYNEVNNFQRLELVWASKASMIQRAGRVGRVADGVVFRLTNKIGFDSAKEYDQSQMNRISLQKTVLRIKKLDILNSESPLSSTVFSNVYQVLANAFQPPDITKIDRTLERLIHEDALAIPATFKAGCRGGPKYYGCNLQITKLGTFIVEMPCDTHLAKMLIVAATLDVHCQLMDIVAIISYKRNFFVQFDKRQNPEDYVKTLIDYDQSGFNDFNAKQRILNDWICKWFLPWKRANYRQFQVRSKQPIDYGEEEEDYFQSYKGSLIDSSRLLNAFMSEKTSNQEIAWCTSRCVWSNNLRDILNLGESIRMKMENKLQLRLGAQGSVPEVKNILGLVCLFVAFKNNLVQIEVQKKTSTDTNQDIDLQLFLSNTTFSESDVFTYLDAPKQNQLRITKENSTIKVIGGLRNLAKLRLPYRTRKSKVGDNVSQVFSYLVANNPAYSYTFSLRQKRHSKHVIVDDDSINKAQFFSGSHQGYLLTNHFFESGRGLVVRDSVWMSSQQATLLLMIFGKNVFLGWNKTQEFFQRVKIQNTVYELPFYITNQLLGVLKKMRGVVKDIYDLSKKQADHQYFITTILYLFRSCELLKQLPPFEDWQQLYAEQNGFVDRKGKYSQQIDSINHIVDVPEGYHMRYKRWKRQTLTNLEHQFAEFKYENCIMICKQCYPKITVVCGMENIDKEKRVFIEKESTSDWKVRDKILYCMSEAGHNLGSIQQDCPIIDCEESLILRYPNGDIKEINLKHFDFLDMRREEIQQRKQVLRRQNQHREYSCSVCYQDGIHHQDRSYLDFRKHYRSLKHREAEKKFKRFM